MTAPTEQVSPVEQESPDDPELYHWYCENGSRNNPAVTVMCCGLPAEKAGATKPRESEPECLLCLLAMESGACSCFYWS